MADNTSQTGADTIATDDVTTLNGGASSGVKVERVKVGYGDDGTYRDSSSAFPLPSSIPSATTTGTITAANATPDAGAGTANSSVVLTIPDNHASVSIQLSGTFSAGTTLAFQTSIDGGTTWWYTNARRSANTLGLNELQSLTSTDVAGGAAPAGGNPSFWRGTTGSSALYRVTCISYTASDSITVRLLSSGGVGGTYQLGSIPAGSSNIGGLYPTPSVTLGTATGTTAASTGQVGRSVRASGNVAQTTAATLIAAPAAGTRLYVTNIVCANEGSALTVARLFAGSLPAAAGAVAVVNDVFDFPIAGAGGGATVNFPPAAPWALPAATALSFAVTVATTWYITVTYYCAP